MEYCKCGRDAEFWHKVTLERLCGSCYWDRRIQVQCEAEDAGVVYPIAKFDSQYSFIDEV